MNPNPSAPRSAIIEQGVKMEEEVVGIPEPAFVARDPAPAIPEGWTSLDVKPDDEGAVLDGLLANGTICCAEWWGPVPADMYKPGQWDGSGWAYDDARAELIAWRTSTRPKAKQSAPW